MTESLTKAMDHLLRPRSVAIIGASDKPGALGASVLSNLERNEYPGDIHLINPNRTEIGGRPCLATIEDLPRDVDVAVLAIPRAGVVDSLRSLAKARVRAAIVFSAGFAEGGEAGLAEQRDVTRIAREAGMIVEGPNCLGLVNYIDRVPLTFVETDIARPAGRPGISIVSQSGAMAAVLGVMISSRSLGLAYSVSTGNEAASGAEDYVDYLIGDPNTRVIAMIVEQFRNPRRFLSAARQARKAGKLIVLLHPGKSSAARASAATHTGAIAGDHALMRAKVANEGVVIAETLEELADITEIAIRCPQPPSGGTAVLGESGAFKALTLDLCEDLGLDLPPIGDDDSPALRAALPDFVAVSNPLDLTAQGLADPDLYYRTLAALFDDKRFGAVVMGIIQTDPVTVGLKVPPILRAIRDLRPAKPILFAGLDEGAKVPVQVVEDLRALGVPYFPSTERTFRAVKRLMDATDRRQTRSGLSPMSLTGLAGLTGVVPEYKAKELLAAAGIAIVGGGFVTRVEEAVGAAEAAGYPVVLKAQSAQLSHKSDAGGVVLNLADAEAVRAGWRTLIDNVRNYGPSITLEGVLVEPMAAPGVELILGARNDPEWGPILLAGFGGVTAEIFKDVRLLTPDLGTDGIVSELLKLKNAPLLTGFRGSPPFDVLAVADMIARLGRIVVGEPSIREIDLNPVVVYPEGSGAIALDALMLVSD